jgi:hypothetical protein
MTGRGTVRVWIADQRFFLRYRLARFGLALRYARNRLQPGDASVLLQEMEDEVGWYCLEPLDAERVRESALCRWQPHPDLDELVREACRYVSANWDCSGYIQDIACSEALDRIEAWAMARGIELTETKTIGLARSDTEDTEEDTL